MWEKEGRIAHVSPRPFHIIQTVFKTSFGDIYDTDSSRCLFFKYRLSPSYLSNDNKHPTFLNIGCFLNVGSSVTEAFCLLHITTFEWLCVGDRILIKRKILGAVFSQKNVERDNWQPKLDKLGQVLNLWSSRQLSYVGRALVINILAASIFFYLAKVFLVPNWVRTSFDRLVWPFLWRGRTQTVKRNILINKYGGLKLVYCATKSKALLVLNLTSFLSTPFSCKWHFFARYHIGRRLASLDLRWRNFSLNNAPNAFQMSEVYSASFTALKDYFSANSGPISTTKAYETFVAQTAEPPTRIHSRWLSLVGRNFNWSNLWKLIRHPTGENPKNDLWRLIVMCQSESSFKEMGLQKLWPLFLLSNNRNLGALFLSLHTVETRVGPFFPRIE